MKMLLKLQKNTIKLKPDDIRGWLVKGVTLGKLNFMKNRLKLFKWLLNWNQKMWKQGFIYIFH